MRTQRYRNHRNLQAVAVESAVAPAVADDRHWAERLLIVHELERMGDPRAAVLRMAFIEDRSQDDIAEALGLLLGTVKSHVRRGLIELRQRLKEVENLILTTSSSSTWRSAPTSRRRVNTSTTATSAPAPSPSCVKAAALLSRSGADDLAYAGWSAPPAGVWSRVAATITAERSSAPAAVPTPQIVSEPDRACRSLHVPSPPRRSRWRGSVEEHGRDHSGEHGESPRARVTPLRRDRTTSDRCRPSASSRLALGCRHGCRGPRHRPGRRTDALDRDLAPVSTVAQAELDTLDTKQRLGEATVVRTGSGVDLRVATTSPLDPGDGYLEVWLINSDGKRMVSVGVLGSTESGTFPISQALLDEGYVVVDISREHFDDRPEHSADSVVRGALPA